MKASKRIPKGFVFYPTERPWYYEGQFPVIKSKTGFKVCHVGGNGGGAELAQANAALIVRAVNNHDALVEVLREMLTAFDCITMDGSGPMSGAYKATRDKARAILAEVEG